MYMQGLGDGEAEINIFWNTDSDIKMTEMKIMSKNTP